jgi:hypothetical protein
VASIVAISHAAEYTCIQGYWYTPQASPEDRSFGAQWAHAAARVQFLQVPLGVLGDWRFA